MSNRRKFIKLSALGSAGLIANESLASENHFLKGFKNETQSQSKPIIISTWNHGIEANVAAWDVISKGGSALDAVEKGVRVTESDAENLSVGLGGLPDRDGIVTLDACIMDQFNNCGAVAFVQNFEHPISIARKVMEDTNHVMLAGKGAEEFALEKGFTKTNLLTDKAKKQWEQWKLKSEYKPKVNSENHDTISMLAIDENGDMCGACTTSGMAYKLHGRVGDSPIIGAGLFVDNEVGGACATGVGEAVIRVAGSAIVVELMRHGMSPTEACKEAVNRILRKHKNVDNLQVGFLAMNKKGEYGAWSVYSGFNYAVHTEKSNNLIDSEFFKKEQ